MRQSRSTEKMLEHQAAAIAAGPLLVSQKELSRMLSLSERSLFNLRGKGLPFVTVGNAVRYSPTRAMAWIEQNCGPTPKPAA